MRRAGALALALAAAFPAPTPALAANFNDFLPGARAMGMGSAYTAVADDVYGIFYNPAGSAAGDFTQLAFGVGRQLARPGDMSHHSLAYTRPLPLLPGSTVGVGYFGVRQNNVGDKDAFLLHFAMPVPVPQIRLARPLKVGGNVKILTLDSSKGKKTGLGLDGGVILEATEPLRLGLSVTDLASDVGVPNPSLNLGLAYRLKDRFLLAGDMRVRPGLTQFFPGIEAEFFQRLLKLRVGKGFPLDGVSAFAWGFGINYSPLVLDFGMALPFQGFNRAGGGFQMNAVWRFGAPSFYGRFVGTAARQAEDLRAEILELEERQKTLKTEVAAAEADRTGLQEQRRTLENRLRQLQERIREAEDRAERREYERGHPAPASPEPVAAPPKPKPAPAPRPAAAPFPRRHTVQPGDTLRTIAEKHYGDSSLWETIFEANPDKVERGLPVEGAVLVIPAPRGR